VAAFSNHPTFLDDSINLEILNIDYKGRVNLQRDFVKIHDVSKKILKENNISYVYTLKVQNFQEDENKMGIRKIFENEEVKIFKVI
jgi:ribosomal protein L21